MSEENKTSENEENAMLLNGPLAVEFFSIYLSRLAGNKVHLLTSQRYLTVEGGCKLVVIKNARGNAFPEGIDRFVETALEDKSCYGLVPLTESADLLLQERGLEVFPCGPITFFDPNLEYKLYRR